LPIGDGQSAPTTDWSIIRKNPVALSKGHKPDKVKRIIDEFYDFIFLATDGGRQHCIYAVQIIHSVIKFEHKYMQEVDERNFLQLQTILPV
jgi:hypothetical protein